LVWAVLAADVRVGARLVAASPVTPDDPAKRRHTTRG